MKKVIYIVLCGLFFSFSNPSYEIAVLKYRGGGDWYANPSSLTNLITFSNESIKTNIQSKYATRTLDFKKLIILSGDPYYF